MPLTDAGRNLIAQALIGEAFTALNAANARVCVGDSATAFAKTDVDLLGTNFRKPNDSTYPNRSVNVLTYRSTFATSEANFTWNEWAVANSAAGATILNRKVESLGTKPSSEAWQLTLTLTLNNP